MKKKLIYGMLVAVMAAGCTGGTNDSEDMAKEANRDKLDSQKMNNQTAQTTDDMMFTKSDADFVVEAAAGGMTEVELGRLAGTKSERKEVRDFGTMMVRDHASAGMKLKSLAASKNITLPDSLPEEGRKDKDRLQLQQGNDFDRGYINLMVNDHRKDIREFQKAALGAQDANIRAFARNSLPMLYLHLDSIQSMQRRLGLRDSSVPPTMPYK